MGSPTHDRRSTEEETPNAAWCKVRKGLTGDVRPSLKLEVKASQLEHGAEVKGWEEAVQAKELTSKDTKC